MLLACGNALAHGITAEALGWLALLFVALPLIALGLFLWPLAVFGRRPADWDQPLVGWRRLASRSSLLLLLAGLLIAGYVVSQTAGKEVMRQIRAERAERDEAAAARSRSEAERQRVDDYQQCLARQSFVGSWDVRRSGADYAIVLGADGSFQRGEVFSNDANLRLASQGRWRVEGDQVVWLLPESDGERRLAQRVLAADSQAFSLQDPRGGTVRFLRNAGVAAAGCALSAAR